MRFLVYIHLDSFNAQGKNNIASSRTPAFSPANIKSDQVDLSLAHQLNVLNIGCQMTFTLSRDVPLHVLTCSFSRAPVHSQEPTHDSLLHACPDRFLLQIPQRISTCPELYSLQILHFISTCPKLFLLHIPQRISTCPELYFLQIMHFISTCPKLFLLQIPQRISTCPELYSLQILDCISTCPAEMFCCCCLFVCLFVFRIAQCISTCPELFMFICFVLFVFVFTSFFFFLLQIMQCFSTFSDFFFLLLLKILHYPKGTIIETGPNLSLSSSRAEHVG